MCCFHSYEHKTLSMMAIGKPRIQGLLPPLYGPRCGKDSGCDWSREQARQEAHREEWLKYDML